MILHNQSSDFEKTIFLIDEEENSMFSSSEQANGPINFNPNLDLIQDASYKTTNLFLRESKDFKFFNEVSSLDPTSDDEFYKMVIPQNLTDLEIQEKRGENFNPNILSDFSSLSYSVLEKESTDFSRQEAFSSTVTPESSQGSSASFSQETADDNIPTQNSQSSQTILDLDKKRKRPDTKRKPKQDKLTSIKIQKKKS